MISKIMHLMSYAMLTATSFSGSSKKIMCEGSAHFASSPASMSTGLACRNELVDGHVFFEAGVDHPKILKG